MTTDTKAVTRWDVGTDGLSDEVKALWHYKGRYVLFTDHERVVGELREAFELAMTNLGTRNKEVNQLNDALAASRAVIGRLDNAHDTLLFECDNLRAEVERQSKVIESYRNQKKILDTAMEKGNV